MSARRSLTRAAGTAATVGLLMGTAACGTSGSAGASDTVTVTIGYQSKTINTVTAGTLLRELGILERRLGDLGRSNGKTYQVVWQDYPSGPPITAQMVAGKVDIGSMGDYPALVNGSKTQSERDARSKLVSITGYNLRGSLNAVVVPPDSPARTLADLKGQSVSTSVGSAAHGMLVSALAKEGLKPEDVNLVNQEPSVGATAIEGRQVGALSQFVPWPDLLVFKGVARKLYDGGDNELPTMHGVVLREAYAEQHPEVAEAFLASQVEATQRLHENPLEAAKTVARITGLEVEVVYLFNGPNGVVTFDPTLKEPLVRALEEDVPFLKSLGSLQELDVRGFVKDDLLRKVLPDYDRQAGVTTNPAALTGRDEVCGLDVADPRQASEAWFTGEETTVVAATPTCLLRLVKARGKELRVGYVPDTDTGTRTFARTATWVTDPAAPATGRLLPFATVTAAERYVSGHPGSSITEFTAALAAAEGSTP